MHFRQVHNNLTGLKGGKRFSRTGGVPDIAVLAGCTYLLNDCLGGIILVWAQHHQYLMCFVKHDVLGNHPAQVVRIQKDFGKTGQVGNVPVINISPEKGLFERLVTIIGIVLSVNAVADNKYLHILEQSAVCPERMPLIAVNLVKSLFQLQTPAFKLYLHQWQTVN
ncbi:hypothetical protein ES705_47803 [subsurface metagenome]